MGNSEHQLIQRNTLVRRETTQFIEIKRIDRIPGVAVRYHGISPSNKEACELCQHPLDYEKQEQRICVLSLGMFSKVISERTRDA